MSERDRRALLFLIPAVAIFALLYFVVFPFFDAAGSSNQAIESREKILYKYRRVVAATPQHETSNGSLASALTSAEQSLLTGANPALQAAEVQQLVRDVAAAQGISLRSVDFATPKNIGTDYVQVPVTASFAAGMDQLVAFMNALQASSKTLTVNQVRVSAANVAATPVAAAKKQVIVAMVISGIARK